MQPCYAKKCDSTIQTDCFKSSISPHNMPTRQPTMFQRSAQCCPVLSHVVGFLSLMTLMQLSSSLTSCTMRDAVGRHHPSRHGAPRPHCLAWRTAPRYCPSTLTSSIQSLLMSQMNMLVCPSVVIPQGPMSFFMFSNLPENGMVS